MITNILFLKFGCKGANFYPCVQVFFKKKQATMHKHHAIVQFFDRVLKKKSQ